MKILHKSAASITVQVSRSNLTALLAKLNGRPPDSVCTLLRYDQSAECYLRIQAVEDGAHYASRDRGIMHEDTERAMQPDNPGWCVGCTPDPELAPGEVCSGCGDIKGHSLVGVTCTGSRP
jgi:hypothetical protein